jgi:hypothetical protein
MMLNDMSGMKGGEMMQFRMILLIGFVVCVALAFPTDAFAEKGENAQKPSIQNGHAQEVSETVKDQDSISKPSPQAKIEITEPDKPKKKVEKVIPDQASEKAQQTVGEVRQKSERASKPLPSTVKETKKVVNNSQPEKNQKEETKTREKQKTSPITNEIHAKTVEDSSTEDVNQPSTKIVQPVEGNKTESIDEVVIENEEPEDKEKKNSPSSQEKYPKDTKAVHSPSHTKVPDGSSKDRSGNGQNTSSLSVKLLLEAEKYLNLKRNQPLVSRTYEFRNQWDNAPPSPPPELLFSRCLI